jgi:alkanesulfonate monooxygenase SsuD/methylene tetrahydromethanopterin reductase-like flavin-dependent oxidoreductase (luciferase family)
VHLGLLESMRSRWVIGDADQARARIAELAATYGVDEVMVHPVAAAHVGTEPDRSPAREETLRLLA